MKGNCCICNFFKRSFLYQVLIIIAALKLKNAFRYNREFVERIRTFITSIHLPENLLNYLPKNNEYTHKGFLITLILLASFSILNIKFFKFLSGIFCILLGFLYHSPIPKIQESLKQNKKFTFNLESLEENLPELEFILYIGIAFAMIGDSFAEKVCPVDKDKKIVEGEISEKPEEEIKNEVVKKENKKGGKDNNKETNKNKGKGKGKGKKKKE